MWSLNLFKSQIFLHLSLSFMFEEPEREPWYFLSNCRAFTEEVSDDDDDNNSSASSEDVKHNNMPPPRNLSEVTVNSEATGEGQRQQSSSPLSVWFYRHGSLDPLKPLWL